MYKTRTKFYKKCSSYDISVVTKDKLMKFCSKEKISGNLQKFQEKAVYVDKAVVINYSK